MTTAETTQFECIPVTQQNIIHLPLGLLGFEPIKKYVLLSEPGQEPFCWLQVLDDPSLAFLVVSPFEVLPEYKPEISPEDVSFLELTKPEDALLYNIVTLRPNGRATVNLRGPVIVNRTTLKAKQVVIVNTSEYSLQHPIPAAE